VSNSDAGPVLVGGDAEIALGYESPAAPRHLFVSIAVAGPLGEPLFLCSNELSGDDLADAPAAGIFRCTIPKLPLQPGRYSVNVFAQINGVVADWIEHAAFFEVIDSDVFGTGRLPPASHGPLVLQHSWSAEAAERDAARASASHG
jgi:lipopolysaccharide transport system ATP-binding protein